MNFNVQREMNHTYVVIDATEEMIKSDFRFRMLRENKIIGIAAMDVRNINGAYKIYYDVTDMESLEQLMENHSVTYEDMEEVLKALVLTSGELEKYFCESENILLLPSLVFKNRIQNEYEFICFPAKENADERYQVTLLQFFMEHIEVREMEAVEGLFEIYDMAISGVKNYKTLYEKLVSYKNPQIEEEVVENMEEEPQDDDYRKEERESVFRELREKYYIPSLRESLAGLFILGGIVSICVFVYLGWV